MIGRWLIYGLASWAIIIGLWDHDVAIIVAGVAIFAILPLIDGEIQAVGGDELDELWDDGDEPPWIVEAREDIERLPEVM